MNGHSFGPERDEKNQQRTRELVQPFAGPLPPQSQYGHDANLTLFFKTERLASKGKKITAAISNVVSPKFLLT
jgi:hypothetical protein